MVETRYDYVISSHISYRDVDEIEHVLFHLEDANKKIDLKKTITVYDRYYNATELMLKTIQLDSYFII